MSAQPDASPSPSAPPHPHQPAGAAASEAVLPPTMMARLQQAIGLHRGRQFDAARQHYEAVLAAHPRHRDTLHLLGSLLRQTGEPARALALIEQALVVGPADGLALNNYGTVLYTLRRHDEALAAFDRAIAAAPDLVDAHNGRGNVLRASRRLPEAMASFDRALVLRPDYAEVHSNRGNVLRDLRRYDEAVAAYDRAVQLKPDLAEAYNNRAHVHLTLKRHDAAARDYAQALALRPGYDDALGLMLYSRMLVCDWTGLDAEVERLAQAVDRGERASPLLPVLSMFDSPQVHQRAAQVWMQAQHPPNDALGPLPSPAACDRLRIGYLSADFHCHPVGYLIAGLIESHDRTRFEVIGLSAGPRNDDPVQRRLVGAFDRFVDIAQDSDRVAAHRIRALGLDIVIDLGGYTQGSRTGVLAYRVAPLQVAYLGYPGTLGASFIDYVIADRTVIPESERVCYDEKVVWLPWFQPNDDQRAVADTVFERRACGLPDDAFVYCCFNNHFKIGPTTFAGWMRILKAVPHGVLWLRDDGPRLAANLRRSAVAAGVAAERIVFAPVLPSNADHLARHRMADVFLDTLPYNAHTTAADALWAGLPVLTCAGRSYAARVGASVLSAAGLPELITSTQADYEALAVALALDRPRMAALRARWAQARSRAPLFDTSRHTRCLEAALDAMQQRHLAGLPPEHLRVDERASVCPVPPAPAGVGGQCDTFA